MNRRDFLKSLAGLVAAAGAPTLLAGCESPQPREFETGEIVYPPQGCEELRRKDERGNC